VIDAFLGLEALYTDKRLSLLNTTAPGYGVVNLTLSSKQRAGHWDWQASIQNLFDRRYFDVPPYSQNMQVIEQEGRTWHLQFSLPL
jgi:outer membrane receptor protein involved in Fe transport